MRNNQQKETSDMTVMQWQERLESFVCTPARTMAILHITNAKTNNAALADMRIEVMKSQQIS